MERSLPSVLFLIASVALSIAAGGWWLQRIAFTPDATRDTAAAILDDAEIRQELNTVIAAASAPTLGTTANTLGTMLEDQVLNTRPGAAVMANIVERAHDRIIGNDDEPVTVSGSELIEVVRDERVAEIDDVVLPIPIIGTLKTTRTSIGWMIPITAVIGVLLMALAILTRPERREVLRGIGEFALALAVAIVVFGYAIPVHMMTAIDNSTWTNAIPRLAMRTLPVVLGSAAVFALCGVALILASTSGGKRRQWSTPLSVTRYRGEDRAWN